MKLKAWKKQAGVTSKWIIEQAALRDVIISESRMTHLMQCKTQPSDDELSVLQIISRNKVYASAWDLYPTGGKQPETA